MKSIAPLKRESDRNHRVFVRATAKRSDVRRAKRWVNRMADEAKAFKGKYGPITAKHRNNMRRVILRTIARPKPL